ncbi:hypothetical protein EBZ38_05380 [bacterium]|nr:hypothetical protein [bacterium]
MKSILFWAGLTALAFQDFFKRKDAIEGHSIGKIYRISKDVDMIYNKFFKKGVQEIEKTGILTRDTFKEFSFDSSILKSAICKKAHQKNPVDIYVNHFYDFYRVGMNHYNPEEKRISIGIQYSAWNFALSECDGVINDAIYYLTDKNQFPLFKSEFMDYKIKGTIHHELAHWLDDSLYGGFLGKELNKMQVMASKKKRPTVKNVDVYASSIEIQALIHNIVQAKRIISQEEWDKLYFDDLMKFIPSVKVVYNRLPYNEQKLWLRKLRDRMFREGLLGKKMKYGW